MCTPIKKKKKNLEKSQLPVAPSYFMEDTHPQASSSILFPLNPKYSLLFLLTVLLGKPPSTRALPMPIKVNPISAKIPPAP